MIGVETVATRVYSSFKLMGVVRIISIALARSRLKQWSVTLRVAGIILLSVLNLIKLIFLLKNNIRDGYNMNSFNLYV